MVHCSFKSTSTTKICLASSKSKRSLPSQSQTDLFLFSLAVAGIFDCGSYYVNISCTGTALILRNSYHRFNRSLQAEFEYHLDWQQISNIAQELFTYLQKIQKRDPQAYVTTGYGGENLLDRLPVYRKSSLLVP